MADDIVSTVRLEGAEEAEAQFKSLGDAGAASMAKIGQSVQPTNKEIEAAGKHIEGLARKFGESIRSTAGAATQFISNVGRMASTVTKFAAMGGLAATALKKFSSANADTATETKQAIAQSRLQTRSFADGQIRALENAKAVRQLNAQFGTGAMSMKEWVKASAEMQRSQAEEQNLAEQTALIKSAEAEDRIRAEAAIKKEAAANKAYSEAVKAYGADAAGAMMALAPAWDSFMAKMNEGPSLIGDIMRGLTQLFNNHGTEIVTIFNRIGNAFASLFSTGGGDTAGDFSEAMMTGIRTVAGAIENILIPAVKVFVAVMTPIADGINALFGTKLTGGMVAAGVALTAYAGGFKLLANGIGLAINAFNMLRSAISFLGGVGALFTPWGIAIAAIVVAIILLIKYWDQIKPVVMAVITAVSDYLTKMGEDITASVQQFKDAWNTVSTFFTELWTTITTAFTDAWNVLAEGYNTAVQALKDAWNTVATFFTDLWAKIKQIAIDGWNSFLQAASDAIKKVKDWLLGLIPGLKQVIALFKDLNAEKAKAAESEGKGHKMGGPIRGPGTSTSDSIPIRASRGEWVIQAKAVQHYGRSFMAALNSMRLPRGFDMGSMAEALVVAPPRARFATGGEVGSRKSDGRPVILQFPDGRSFAMNASNETADSLGRYATSRRLAGAGRKPSYFGAT